MDSVQDVYLKDLVVIPLFHGQINVAVFGGGEELA